MQQVTRDVAGSPVAEAAERLNAIDCSGAKVLRARNRCHQKESCRDQWHRYADADHHCRSESGSEAQHSAGTDDGSACGSNSHQRDYNASLHAVHSSVTQYACRALRDVEERVAMPHARVVASRFLAAFLGTTPAAVLLWHHLLASRAIRHVLHDVLLLLRSECAALVCVEALVCEVLTGVHVCLDTATRSNNWAAPALEWAVRLERVELSHDIAGFREHVVVLDELLYVHSKLHCNAREATETADASRGYVQLVDVHLDHVRGRVVAEPAQQPVLDAFGLVLERKPTDCLSPLNLHTAARQVPCCHLWRKDHRVLQVLALRIPLCDNSLSLVLINKLLPRPANSRRIHSVLLFHS
mmetsp:Transcript_18069/g.69916  ORF Transcript_18069/g.69916 Transcript_18069/m.69916 type:complete len:356 (+) Transcript_18069:309-1376(+)